MQEGPRPGMFGAGASPMRRLQGGGMMPRDKAPDGLAYGPSGFGQGAAVPGGPMSLGGGGFGVHDYAGDIRGALADNALMPKPKSGPNWGKIGQVVSAGLAGYLAARGNPAGLALMQQNHLMQRERAEALNRQELERMKAQLPQQVGDSLIVPDGMGGFQTVFRDPQPFEAYAESLGYQPGSPEYLQAIQDYRLGSWSDPAVAAKTELEGVRYGFRDNLQDQRLDVTKRGQDIRSTDTRRGQDITRGNNIRSTSTSRDNSIRSNETQRGAHSYTHGSGGKGKGGFVGPVLSGPDGRRIQYNPAKGGYVDLATGAVVK